MSVARGNVKMALSSLKKTKWRSALTMFGIVVGIVSVVTIASFGNGIKQQVAHQVAGFGKDLFIVRPGAISNDPKSILQNNLLFGETVYTGLTPQDFQTVRSAPGVGPASPLGIVSGHIAGDAGQKMPQAQVLAASSDLPALINHSMSYGSFFDNNDAQGVVVGQQVAYALYGESAPLGKTISFRGQTFIIRGVFSDFNAPAFSPAAHFDTTVFMPYLAAQTLPGAQTQYYNILVKPTTHTSLNDVMQSVASMLQTSHGGQTDFSVLDEKRRIDLSNTTTTAITTFTTFVAGISLLVGGVGIMNIMLVSVTERMHEIGIRKAVGATNHQILTQFMLESAVLSGLGGVIGISLSVVVSLILRTYSVYHPSISWTAIVVASFVSIAIGIIFGTAPAIKAAQKDPIDALRHE